MCLSLWGHLKVRWFRDCDETADGGRETISADLVIEASRHGALTLSFLKSRGLPLPEETTIGVDIRYATGLFALSPEALGQFKAIVTFPKAPEDVRYGYLLPVENNRHQLLLVGRGQAVNSNKRPRRARL